MSTVYLDVAHRMTRQAGDCLCVAIEVRAERDTYRALAIRYLEQAADVLGYRLTPKGEAQAREAA